MWGGMERPGGDRSPTRTEPTNQGPEGLAEAEAPTMDHARTGPRPPRQMETMAAQASCESPRKRTGGEGKGGGGGLFCLPSDHSPLAGLSCQITEEEDKLNLSPDGT